MMKISLAVLLALGLALSTTACGDADTREDERETIVIETTVENTQNEEEEYKRGCIDEFDYNEYFRYPDNHVGEDICVTVEVVQLLEDGFRGMDINGKIYLTWDISDEPNLQLGDIITVWGVYEGVFEHETTDKNYMGFFTVNAKYVKFVDEMVAEAFQESAPDSFQEDLSQEYVETESASETITDNPYMDSILLWKSYYSELTGDDLAGLSKDELRLARNEIYAAHGRIFTSQDLIDYFNSKPWYQGTVPTDQFSESVLTEIQKQNVSIIQSNEKNGQDNYAARGLTENDIDGAPRKEGNYFYYNGTYEDHSTDVLMLVIDSSGVYAWIHAEGMDLLKTELGIVSDQVYWPVYPTEETLSLSFDGYGSYANVEFPGGEVIVYTFDKFIPK